MVINPLVRPDSRPRTVTILGSTGSIGQNTLDLIRRNSENFCVEVLTAHNNVEELIKQCLEFKPKLVAIANPAHLPALKEALAHTRIEILSGPLGIIEAANYPTDWVMAAIVGAQGLSSTVTALKRGAIVAIANKESLICAGSYIMDLVSRTGATLLPVDSEHNAIFQVFDPQQRDRISRLILTASGGPFLKRNRGSLVDITPEQAVAHPKWSMGAKISVDSATMMNKGLEIIEAHHLFKMPGDQIDVLIHPQSIVHSLVEYQDGSQLAQLGPHDMRTPIAFTLAWPERMPSAVNRINLAEIGTLHFEAPDLEQFPALKLTRQAMAAGGAAPLILNAANEIAVAAFLDKKLPFLKITDIIEKALHEIPSQSLIQLDEIIAFDLDVRTKVQKLLERT